MKILKYYYWPQCYFCQRVTIYLAEKNIKHEDVVINLLKYENFDPEFVAKNPLCLVPVIEDSGKTIMESDKIIDYLEDNNVEHKLYPDKTDKVEWEDVHKYIKIIANLPIGQIHFGCNAPKYRKYIKMDPEFIEKYLSMAKGKAEYLENMAKKHPELADTYEKRLLGVQQLNLAKMEGEIDNNIAIVRNALKDIENQLIKMKAENKEWICTNFFSIADIYICDMLHRLDINGLAPKLWEVEGHELPHVAAYFKKGMDRPSVKSMIPQYKSPRCRLAMFQETLANFEKQH